MPPLSTPRRRLLALAVVGFALVGLINGWLHVVGPLPGDRASLPRLNNAAELGYGPGTSRDVYAFFTSLGTPVLAAPMILFLAATARVQFGRRAALFVVLAAGCVFANAITKAALGPSPLFAEVKPAFGDPSGALNFPSGHVAYASSLFGSMAYLGWRHRRWDLLAPAVAVIVGMGPARVLVGAHFPSDVVAGYLFGASWLVVSVVIVDVVGGRRRRAGRSVPDRGRSTT